MAQSSYKEELVQSIADKQSPSNGIVYDFCAVDTNQDKAVMPAWLAVKLLESLALKPESGSQIVYAHIDELRDNSNDIEKCLELSLQFIQTRQLCNSIMKGDLNAYKV